MLKKFPIHELVQSGNAAELRRYIENEKRKKRQINLNVVDAENKTPLHVAVQTHRIDIVETLLAEFPDVTLKDADGYTPLHVACSETGNEDIIKTLLKQPGLEINTGNRDNNTALHYFARHYSSPAAEPLFRGFIERGAKLDVQNSKFETPLHAAVFHKNIPVVGWLLQAGASPNLCAEKGDTPLHRAVMMDQLELVQMLLKSGANPSLAGSGASMGRPIDLAIARNQPAIIARLKEAESAQKRQSEMAEWLRLIGLEKYTPLFLKDEWDLDSISMIDEKMLIAMGLPPAPRLRFLKEAKDRADKAKPKESPTTARQPTAAATAAEVSAAIIDAQRKQLGQNTIIDYKDLKMGDMLGKGFFAEVRRAEWCGCKVAVKIIYRESFKNKSDLELFYQEAEILSKLRFPNVVQFFGYCVGDHHCLVTEYMKEGSLYSLLHDHPEQVLGIPKVQLSICMDIAKGMNYLHALRPPIVHRDLTSKNVLLGEHFIAKVADFGLSKEKDVTGTLTHSVGALPLASPEVFRGEPYTEAADVYSYGIIVWETFTGQDPQGEQAPLQYAQKVAYESYRPPILPSIPPPIEELIKRCWDPKPTQRPTFEQISKMLKHISKQKDKERRADRLKSSTTSVVENPPSSATPSSGSQASSLANSIAAVTPHEVDLLAQYGGNPVNNNAAGAHNAATTASSTSSSSPSPVNSLAGSNKVNSRTFADDDSSSSSSAHRGRNSPVPPTAGVLDVYLSTPALSTTDAPKLEVKSQSLPSIAAGSDDTVSSSSSASVASATPDSLGGHTRASLKNSSLNRTSGSTDLARGDLLASRDEREKKAKKEKKSHRPTSVVVTGSLVETPDEARRREKREKKEKKRAGTIGDSGRSAASASPAGTPLTGSGNPAALTASASVPNAVVTPPMPTIAVSDRSVPTVGGGGSAGDVSAAQARQQQLHMYHQFAFKPAAKSPKPGLSLSQKASAAAIGGADYHKDESKDSDEDASST